VRLQGGQFINMSAGKKVLLEQCDGNPDRILDRIERFAMMDARRGGFTAITWPVAHCA
jgi:hypothetical protein